MELRWNETIFINTATNENRATDKKAKKILKDYKKYLEKRYGKRLSARIEINFYVETDLKKPF